MTTNPTTSPMDDLADIAAGAYKQGYRDSREDADGVIGRFEEAMQEGCAQWLADNSEALRSPIASREEEVERVKRIARDVQMDRVFSEARLERTMARLAILERKQS